MSYQVLVVIVVINVVITLSIWRRLKLLQPRPPQPNKRFIKSFWRSKPIMPKHQQPKATNSHHEHDKIFFLEFARFADVVNEHFTDEDFGSSWRLQELPETMLHLTDSDMPDYGRAYEIFFNQEKIGKIEVQALTDFSVTPLARYGIAKPDGSEPSRKVRTSIELQFVRLFTYEAITGFLMDIVSHVTDYPRRNSEEYLQATKTITNALVKAMWDNRRISGDPELDGIDWGEVSVQIDGTPSWYLDKRNAVKAAA